MHFVREFWCEDSVRVFDSNFVVREVDGAPTLLEVFEEVGVAAQMQTEVLDDGGISMTIVGLFIRGIRVGVGPWLVRFETRPTAEGSLSVQGILRLETRSWLSRTWWHGVLGLPSLVGEIRYLAVPEACEEGA